jgi:hypothetical protein
MRATRRRLATTAVSAVVVLALVPTASAAGTPAKRVAFPQLTGAQLVPLARAQPQDKARSCAKGAARSKIRLAGSRATSNMARKAVVACEQPPRSQLLPLIGGLKHAQAALNVLIG